MASLWFEYESVYVRWIKRLSEVDCRGVRLHILMMHRHRICKDSSSSSILVVEVVFVDLVINGSSGQTGVIRNPSCCTVTVSAVTIYAARARTVMILLELRVARWEREH